MASIKHIKKSVNNLTFELISECYVYKHFHKSEKTDKKVDKIIEDIVTKRNELIEKTNNPENKDDLKANKEYYKNLRLELAKMVNLMDKLN